jgi:hypothetical protein
MLKRGILATALLVVAGGVGFASGDRNPAEDPRVVIVPNPHLSCRMDHEPTPEDLARLVAVKGQPAAEVIRWLGHPSHVSTCLYRSDTEWWWYNWGKEGAQVEFRNGRVVEACYNPERQTGFIEPASAQ